MDKFIDEGHLEDCDKWMDLAFPCTCSVRLRGMPEPIDFDTLDPSEYSDWAEENPPRVSKNARPTHTEDGRSVGLLQRIIGRKGKK